MKDITSNLVILADDWFDSDSMITELAKQLEDLTAVLKVDISGLTTFHYQQQYSHNNKIFMPQLWPLLNKRLLKRINRYFFKKHLRAKLQEIGLQKLCIIVTSTEACAMVADIPGVTKVAFISDLNTKWRKRSRRDSLEKLLEPMQLVIVAKSTIIDELPTDKTCLLLPGINYELFTKTYPRPATLPVKGLLAGCYVEDPCLFDFEFFISLSRQLPDWRFIFLYRDSDAVEQLSKHQNIFSYQISKKKEIVPYLQYCDVLIMPINEEQENNPDNLLRVWEYLAIAKPVIASTSPLLNAYADILQLADNVESFVAKMIMARQLGDENKQQSHAMAQQETWSKRAKKVMHIIRYM